VVQLALEDGSIMSFEATGTTYPVMQHHLPEYWNYELLAMQTSTVAK
jgi:hypothetical protein